MVIREAEDFSTITQLDLKDIYRTLNKTKGEYTLLATFERKE